MDCYTDAVALPCSPQVEWDSELKSQLGRKAGQSVLEEARRKGPVPVGEAVVTTGGGMLARFVIHVALCPSDQTRMVSADERRALLSTGIANCFLRGAELPEVESLGLPDLGRYLGFPADESAALMVAAIRNEVHRGGGVREIHLMLRDEADVVAFRRVLSA